MASAEWMEVYRSYSLDELREEITTLRGENSAFTAQATGSKSFTRDLLNLRDRLQAATRVQNERGNLQKPSGGTVDYSQADTIS